MNPQSPQAILTEIQQIQRELDESHDTDIDYLPLYIKDLRNYIFQVHAAFEQSMKTLIIMNYLQHDKPYKSHILLLEQISFEGKMRIVAPISPLFPLKNAKQLNHLRNSFAHQEGESLRQTYNDLTRLKVLRFLKRCNQKLNDFWEAAHSPSASVSPSPEP